MKYYNRKSTLANEAASGFEVYKKESDKPATYVTTEPKVVAWIKDRFMKKYPTSTGAARLQLYRCMNNITPFSSSSETSHSPDLSDDNPTRPTSAATI